MLLSDLVIRLFISLSFCSSSGEIVDFGSGSSLKSGGSFKGFFFFNCCLFPHVLGGWSPVSNDRPRHGEKRPHIWKDLIGPRACPRPRHSHPVLHLIVGRSRSTAKGVCERGVGTSCCCTKPHQGKADASPHRKHCILCRLRKYPNKKDGVQA